MLETAQGERSILTTPSSRFRWFRGIRRYGIYADGWSFHSKATIIQLQAPDIWAYENYWYAVDRSDDVTQSIVVTQ